MNIGCGTDVSIKELAELICFIVGYKGALVFDSSKPDGVMRKLMSSEKINEMDWKPSINLEEGIKKSIEEFKSKHKV